MNKMTSKIILMPLIFIFLMSIMVSYTYIYLIKLHHNENIRNFTESYNEEQYKKIKNNVDGIRNTISYANKIYDETQSELKARVLRRINHINMINTPYVFILKLININGGDNFAKIIFYNNKPQAIGKFISDSKKDINNKYFLKKVLKDIKQKGYSYVIYKHAKPNNKNINKKLTYFYLDKKFNWIITSSIFLDEVNTDINKKNKKFEMQIKKLIQLSVFITIILSCILGIISYFFSKNISKQIEYTKEKLKINVAKEIEKNQLIEKQLIKSEKMVAMGEMIGNIAHQWRQPLSVISTASTGIIMQKEYGVLDDDKLIKTCHAINDNAQYLSKTIDDFKNFIKGDRTKEIFNLKNGIDSFLNLVEGSIKNYNINIILDLKKNIEINGYENELIQCCINVFNNAKDVLVENNIEDKLIFLSIYKKEDKAIIKIKDNGGGIPDDILPKIFEPYFTTKHQSQGTGLGLHMTHNLIVDGMGGTIEATKQTYTYDDKEYTGAEFVITLPLN
ncbi:MAG: cache domain-containing protein [Arcobacteraceae bacterium]|nr:cache domain-containing protein [Arcobacteraceae bacterium]